MGVTIRIEVERATDGSDGQTDRRSVSVSVRQTVRHRVLQLAAIKSLTDANARSLARSKHGVRVQTEP